MMMESAFAELVPIPLLIEIKNVEPSITFAGNNSMPQQIEFILEEQTIEDEEPAQVKYEVIEEATQIGEADCANESSNLLEYKTKQVSTETNEVSVQIAQIDNPTDIVKKEPGAELICFECSETFETKEIFDIHMSGHTNNMKCAICNMVLKSLKNYEKHCLRCKPYECQICGRVVRFRPNFIKHMRVHTSQQSERHKHKCDVCKKEFMSFEYFKVHKKIHNENVNLTCGICGKVFSALASLRGHTKLHTGIKLHKCDICGKGFGQRYNLKIHSRVHCSETQYECSICSRKLYNLANYNAHIESHKAESGGDTEPAEDMQSTSDTVSSSPTKLSVEVDSKETQTEQNQNQNQVQTVNQKLEDVQFSRTSLESCNDNSSNDSQFPPHHFDSDLIDSSGLSDSLTFPSLFENDSITSELYLGSDDKCFPFDQTLSSLQSTTDGNFIRKEWVYSNYVVGSDKLCSVAGGTDDDDDDETGGIRCPGGGANTGFSCDDTDNDFCGTTSFIYD